MAYAIDHGESCLCRNARPTRWALLGAVGLIFLASCRGPASPDRSQPGFAAPAGDWAHGANVATTRAGWNGPHHNSLGAAAGPLCPLPDDQPLPHPMQPCSPWRPAGLPCPWPQDEYICDGGDGEIRTGVMADWEVRGLEVEDTVAHFDTVDGRTLVEPSNRVCIYAPRFASVRQVVNVVAHERHDQAGGTQATLRPSLGRENLPVVSSRQNLQPLGQIAARPPVNLQSRQGDGVVSDALVVRAFQDAFLPYEDLAILRCGQADASQAAMLAKGAAAAMAWTVEQSAQALVDNQGVVELVRDDQAQEVFTYKSDVGSPKLRVLKVASTATAAPGETVDFTIRFDNVGTQVIGNVTILDSLSPRLEFVHDSAQCSREAKFFTESNSSGSLVVRCELAEPLKPNEGGVIRFSCRVR